MSTETETALETFARIINSKTAVQLIQIAQECGWTVRYGGMHTVYGFNAELGRMFVHVDLDRTQGRIIRAERVTRSQYHGEPPEFELADGDHKALIVLEWLKGVDGT